MRLAILLGVIGLPAGFDRRVELRLPIVEAREFELDGFVSELSARAGLRVEPPRTSLTLPFEGTPGALSRSLLGECLEARITFDPRDDHLLVRIDWDEEPPPAQLTDRLGRLVEIARSASRSGARYGFHARDSYRPNDAVRPTICLLHGINASSRSFVHLVPLLEAEGYGVILYDYAYNGDLDELGDAFAREVSEFRDLHADRAPWTMVTHSMGGLLARDYVEGDAFGHDVTRLVMIGPPNQGAATAQGQAVLRWIDALRASDQGRAKVLADLQEGLGAAGRDLVPESPYLLELNARPRRAGVSYHILAGDGGFLTPATRDRLLAEYRTLRRNGGLLAGLVGTTLPGLPEILAELSQGTGDGCVAVESTRLDGVADHHVIHVDHVALVRGPLLFPEPGPVACWDFLRSRLRTAEGGDQPRPARSPEP